MMYLDPPSTSIIIPEVPALFGTIRPYLSVRGLEIVLGFHVAPQLVVCVDCKCRHKFLHIAAEDVDRTNSISNGSFLST